MSNTSGFKNLMIIVLAIVIFGNLGTLMRGLFSVIGFAFSSMFSIFLVIGIFYIVKSLLHRSKDVVEDTKEQFAHFTEQKELATNITCWKEYQYIERNLTDDESKYAKRIRREIFTTNEAYKDYLRTAKRIRSYIKERDITTDFYHVFDKNDTLLREMRAELKAINLYVEPSPVTERKLLVMWQEMRHIQDDLVTAIRAHAEQIEKNYLRNARDERSEMEAIISAKDAATKRLDEKMNDKF